ncbi:MAG: Uma2 family endonuclease [Anaerolineales bacterium]
MSQIQPRLPTVGRAPSPLATERATPKTLPQGPLDVWESHLWPDHTQLPAEDGTFVKNFQEHPQSMLLTDTIQPVLRKLHPDGQYAIGQDSGIYWRLAEPGEALTRGAEAPDWFYVPHVPPLLDGQVRRSYVLWREHVPPLIAIEFVSGDGTEERDPTPRQGKFWIYEQMIRPAFYAIYEVKHAKVEVHRLAAQGYELVPANAAGRYPIPPLGVELGIWKGRYQNQALPWLRWWDAQGQLLSTSAERAAQEREAKEQAQQQALAEREAKEQAQQQALAEQRRARREREAKERAQQQTLAEREAKEQAQQQALAEQRRTARLIAQLRALGIEPHAD